MTKRLVELDDELLTTAQRELNTSGVSDTIRTALQLAANRSARLKEIDWLVGGGLKELADRENRSDVWR